MMSCTKDVLGERHGVMQAPLCSHRLNMILYFFIHVMSCNNLCLNHVPSLGCGRTRRYTHTTLHLHPAAYPVVVAAHVVSHTEVGVH